MLVTPAGLIYVRLVLAGTLEDVFVFAKDVGWIALARELVARLGAQRSPRRRWRTKSAAAVPAGAAAVRSEMWPARGSAPTRSQGEVTSCVATPMEATW
jgi:hypothetical protein